MSILRIDTNVSHLDIDDAFLVESTEALAKTLKKPKSVSTYIIFILWYKNIAFISTYLKFNYVIQ